jgi:NADH-quinone oxidoreductase subunit G
MLATPHQTLEELFLLGKLARAFSSGNADFRLRQSDFSADGRRAGAPWLGMKLADLNWLDRALVVGSALTRDHPLIGHRLRQATRRGLQLNLVNPFDDNLLMRVANKAVVAPSAMADMLAQVARAVAEAKERRGAWVRPRCGRVGRCARDRRKPRLGKKCRHISWATWRSTILTPRDCTSSGSAIAGLAGARFGFLGEAANSVGGYLAGCVPTAGGRDAGAMLREPLKAYLLLGVEAELDTHDPQQAIAAMKAAELVVAMSPYQHGATAYAHVILPVAPYTETSGTFVNTEGTVQSFNGVVQPLGETRPAWKVLRVLGNLLGVPGFEYDSPEELRREVLGPGGDIAGRLDNGLGAAAVWLAIRAQRTGLERVAEVPPYAADAIVRRARSLQQTRDAAPPVASMNRALADKLGLREGDLARVGQGTAQAVVAYSVDDKLPADCVRLATARPETATLGAMFGSLTVERVPGQQKVAV